MPDQETTEPLTEARIKRIVELSAELLKRTRKDAKKFLQVPRLPDPSRGETITDVVSPQVAKYFAGWDEDPVIFFRDRNRLFMIYHAISSGGIQSQLVHFNKLRLDDAFTAAISNMKEKGFGDPEAVEAMLPQARQGVKDQIKQLESVSPEEEKAVKNCLPEIEETIFPRKGAKPA